MFERISSWLKTTLGFFGSILVWFVSLIIYCPPLLVISLPTWAYFLIIFVMMSIGEFADFLSIPLWIWALLIALKHPTHWLHIIFFVLFAVVFLPNLFSMFGNKSHRRR